MEESLRLVAGCGDSATQAEEFEQIVRLHQRGIYRLLLSLVRDPDAAETLTQDCFLKAYNGRGAFRGDASLRTWLVTIAINLARDHGRSRRQKFWRSLFRSSAEESESALSRAADPRCSAEQALLAREELARVWEATSGLSEKQRTAFLLRFVEEMTLDEIAAAMSIDVGTVKAHLFRAVSSVRKRAKERSK